MRLSLKAKLTALTGLIVLLVVLAISTLYLSSLTRESLADVGRRGQYVADEVYHQAQTVLSQSPLPANVSPADSEAVLKVVQLRLARDAGLNSTIESAVGYSATTYYVAITDTQGVVIVHDDPTEIGTTFAAGPPFNQLLNSSVFHQLRVIYGPPGVYDIALPIKMGDRPLGDVRVGVATLFVANQLTPELRKAFLLAGLAIILGAAFSSLLSFRLLRPLQTISRNVERMARGELTEPLKVTSKDEWGILSSKLNLLGEQMRGEKAAYLKLKENLDQLFQNLADGLLLFDKQDRLVLATSAVTRFLDAAPEALLHRTANDIFGGDQPMDNALRAAFLTRRPITWESSSLDDAEDVPRMAVSVQFAEAQGEPVGALVTIRDAGTRAQLEDQIDLATKLAALGRITSGLAHEVKNPLNAMVLQMEILKTKLSGREGAIQPQLDVLSEEIQRLDRVVKTFLDFTRPVELHLSETNLEDLARDVFTLAEPEARQNNVRLVLVSNGFIPPVKVDRDMIKQVLLNLVLNGCQAMPSGGDLKVKPSNLTRRVELEIADQGIGIPSEVQPKIFSLFFSTKPGGSGIGLAMAYRIIQLHNGSIGFSSEPDIGTTFRVSLPV